MSKYEYFNNKNEKQLSTSKIKIIFFDKNPHIYNVSTRIL